MVLVGACQVEGDLSCLVGVASFLKAFPLVPLDQGASPLVVPLVVSCQVEVPSYLVVGLLVPLAGVLLGWGTAAGLLRCWMWQRLLQLCRGLVVSSPAEMVLPPLGWALPARLVPVGLVPQRVLLCPLHGQSRDLLLLQPEAREQYQYLLVEVLPLSWKPGFPLVVTPAQEHASPPAQAVWSSSVLSS